MILAAEALHGDPSSTQAHHKYLVNVSHPPLLRTSLGLNLALYSSDLHPST